MNKKNIFLISGLILLILLTFFTFLIFKKSQKIEIKKTEIFQTQKDPSEEEVEIKKFVSQEEFVDYLKKSEQNNRFLSQGLGVSLQEDFLSSPLSTESVNLGLGEKRSFDLKRFSETNVQVLNIDEPDILKNDGKNIYFSSKEEDQFYRIMPFSIDGSGIKRLPETNIWPPKPDYKKPETKIIAAFPPKDMEKLSSLEKNGDLLLLKDEKVLIVLREKEIVAYDIVNPKNPKEKWILKLEDKYNLVESRLYKKEIYLVVRNYIDYGNPCPIKPLMSGTESISISCEEIYHPKKIIPAETIFSVLVLDAIDGKIKRKSSFLGSREDSHIYMSKESIYVAYSFKENEYEFLVEAISQSAKDILPSHVIEHLNKVKDYEISSQSKMTELSEMLEKHKMSLNDDEEIRFENEFSNKLGKYFKENLRRLEKTGIVKIRSSDLKVLASGKVPGYLLNQFSLDEYENNLRVAVSLGKYFWLNIGTSGAEAKVNDVYILDSNLKEIGSIKNLGITERIYSVRFLEDRGYLVTFREIDPFYVLDLSNPQKPEMKGELKIPGYSSYLHPLKDNIILGVGQEESRVKLSLFDVENPSDPREIDKYFLTENWSEAQNNHRAFLQDSKHEIFFLPGARGGYIFSYIDNRLSLKKAISGYQVKRAIYINDYLYIIGEDKITVLDEKSWEVIKEFDLN